MFFITYFHYTLLECTYTTGKLFSVAFYLLPKLYLSLTIICCNTQHLPIVGQIEEYLKLIFNVLPDVILVVTVVVCLETEVCLGIYRRLCSETQVRALSGFLKSFFE